jgi:hypothetical protein
VVGNQRGDQPATRSCPEEPDKSDWTLMATALFLAVGESMQADCSTSYRPRQSRPVPSGRDTQLSVAFAALDASSKLAPTRRLNSVETLSHARTIAVALIFPELELGQGVWLDGAPPP